MLDICASGLSTPASPNSFSALGLGSAGGAAAASVTGAGVGTEISADVRWSVAPGLQVGAIVAKFYSGPAIQEALGKDVTFTALYSKYLF